MRPSCARLLLIVSLLSGSAHGQAVTESTQVSLLTCGQGADLYSTFGHSAIQFSDTRTQLDKVYNYGTFDFNTSNFYLKFTQGKLDYILDVTTIHSFIRSYQYDGRWVYRQLLDLSTAQKEQLFSYLENNAKPENRAYRYDFLYDNCSTRIRDALESTLDESLQYPQSLPDSSIRFRHMLDLYLTHHPWSDLGIDLALGLPCDKITTWREQMFLPDFLKDHLAEARILEKGETRSLVSESGFLLVDTASHEPSAGILWIFWFLFAIAAFTGLFVKASRMRVFDIVLFSSVGLVGIVLALLWFATNHTATKNNLNLLWTLPTWLYGAYLLIAGRPNSRFFKFQALYMFALIVFWALIPQNFHMAVIPLILTLAARSWSWQKMKFQRR